MEAFLYNNSNYIVANKNWIVNAGRVSKIPVLSIFWTSCSVCPPGRVISRKAWSIIRAIPKLNVILLKTERGRKNRYTNFFDRFKECYDRLPEAAAKELDSLMSDYGIRFSPDESILNGEVIDNV